MDTPQAPRKDLTSTYKAMERTKLAQFYGVSIWRINQAISLIPEPPNLYSHRGRYSPAQVARIVDELGHWDGKNVFNTVIDS